ncbi:hypothetical protein CTheo_6379 [Ceratobasidium theobromae]|uniref:Uncharacterized protein n=1 Tax=Ceratobasidium theobromae TaxID=1582974 RepID=A0A5N5QFF6_9AGAM|nr:hypothetical protein CTheo_6379 [Ceratobasidium theobromae]
MGAATPSMCACLINIVDRIVADKDLFESHHKDWPPAYCYCMRCDGKVKQKARTITDHQNRYPRPAGAPLAGLHEGPGPFPPLAAGPSHILNPPETSNSSTPVPSDNDPGSPEGAFESWSPTVSDGNGLEDRMNLDFEEPPRSPLPVGNDLPPMLHGDERPHIPDVPAEFVAAAEGLELEYQFGRGIGKLGYPDYRWVDNAEDDDLGDEFDPEDPLEGINFGLPNDEGLDAGPALPRFQLPDDIEPEEPGDDPEPKGDVNPYAPCVAFHEPDLI